MLTAVLSFLSDLVWQDAVLAVGQLIFIFALFPMLRGTEKPPLATCVIHGLVLASFGVAFVSLTLWFSAASVFVVSGLWFFVGWQKYTSLAE